MNYEEKRMYGEFVRDMLVKTDKNKTWNFFRKLDLKHNVLYMLRTSKRRDRTMLVIT